MISSVGGWRRSTDAHKLSIRVRRIERLIEEYSDLMQDPDAKQGGMAGFLRRIKGGNGSLRHAASLPRDPEAASADDLRRSYRLGAVQDLYFNARHAQREISSLRDLEQDKRFEAMAAAESTGLKAFDVYAQALKSAVNSIGGTMDNVRSLVLAHHLPDDELRGSAKKSNGMRELRWPSKGSQAALDNELQRAKLPDGRSVHDVFSTVYAENRPFYEGLRNSLAHGRVGENATFANGRMTLQPRVVPSFISDNETRATAVSVQVLDKQLAVAERLLEAYIEDEGAPMSPRRASGLRSIGNAARTAAGHLKRSIARSFFPVIGIAAVAYAGNIHLQQSDRWLDHLTEQMPVASFVQTLDMQYNKELAAWHLNDIAHSWYGGAFVPYQEQGDYQELFFRSHLDFLDPEGEGAEAHRERGRIDRFMQDKILFERDSAVTSGMRSSLEYHINQRLEKNPDSTSTYWLMRLPEDATSESPALDRYRDPFLKALVRAQSIAYYGATLEVPPEDKMHAWARQFTDDASRAISEGSSLVNFMDDVCRRSPRLPGRSPEGSDACYMLIHHTDFPDLLAEHMKSNR